MKIIFFSLALLSSGAWADPDCGFNIQMGSFTATVKETSQTLPHSLTLTRSHNSADGTCSAYRLYFGKGNANSYQRRAYSGLASLPYNLYRAINEGNILKDHGDAGSNEYITTLSPDKETPYTSAWYVGVADINTLFTTPAGVYTDVVPINVYNQKSNGDISFQTARYLTLSIVVPRFVELSIVPQGGAHDRNATTYVMDFGELQAGEELRADLRVVGNVGYGVMMSSQNGSKLSNGTGLIPYQIKVGNGGYFTFPGSGQMQVASSGHGTSTQGQAYGLRVKIGTIPSNPSPGDYQDVITVTVQAY